jgi:hypothetical protein
VHSWEQAGQPMRLLQKEARKDEPDPKALSCYGLYLPELEKTWLTASFSEHDPHGMVHTYGLHKGPY